MVDTGCVRAEEWGVEGRDEEVFLSKGGEERGSQIKIITYLLNVNFEEDADKNFVKTPTVSVGPKEGNKGLINAGGDDSDSNHDNKGDMYTVYFADYFIVIVVI